MHSNKYKKSSSIIAKRNKVRRIFGLVLKIGLPVIFLVGIAFLLRADFLQVKNFNVVGEESVSAKDIQKLAAGFVSGSNFFVIPKSNIFLLSKDKLAAAVLAKFSRVEKVDINKNFFNGSVNLAVKERQADYLWCSGDDTCFFMTKDGLVFEKAGFTASDFLASSATWAEPANKLIFEGNLAGNPLMKNFTISERMQNYLKLVKIFKDAGYEIISINIESVDKAIAKSNIGDIIFNPEEVDLSLATQNALLLINEVRSRNSSAEFNYIDTRFDNKLFYKLL